MVSLTEPENWARVMELMKRVKDYFVKVRFLHFLTVLGVAGCAPSFSSVENARAYLLENPNGSLAQEAFCIVAANGESGDIPSFSDVSISTPKIENCTPDGRVRAVTSAGSFSTDGAYEAY